MTRRSVRSHISRFSSELMTFQFWHTTITFALSFYSGHGHSGQVQYILNPLPPSIALFSLTRQVKSGETNRVSMDIFCALLSHL